jgi:hypothetical protein
LGQYFIHYYSLWTFWSGLFGPYEPRVGGNIELLLVPILFLIHPTIQLHCYFSVSSEIKYPFFDFNID